MEIPIKPVAARISLLAALFFLCVSCSKQPAALSQIQQQRSGDYVVTLLSEGGAVKQHSNKLTIEIRNAATNDLVDAGNVRIQATMRMPGSSPMFGDLSPAGKIGTGRYEFDADFGMAGQWSVLATFDPNGRVQLNVNAQ